MRKLTHDRGSVEARGETISQVVADLDRQYPGVRAKMMDDEGGLHRYMNVYVNGDDIRYRQGLDTPVAEGDVVQVIPAAAGGEGSSA